MYLLFVDESGTHGQNAPFVLGGMAIHENDAARMQKDLDTLVIKYLRRAPLNLEEFELHAVEMRNAKKPDKPGGRQSIWAGFPRRLRLDLLDAAYDLIANFNPSNALLPHELFGVAIDRTFHADWTEIEREQFAYEVLLNKFDVMLKTARQQRDLPNRGLVIHDRRVVAERDIQQWTSEWRVAAGKVGQLRNLADVPLFSDSRATRLLQVADLVSYAVFRRYNPQNPDDRYLSRIWSRFSADGDTVHGCVHFTPEYGTGQCGCDSCRTRLIAEAAARASSSGTRGPRGRGRTRAGKPVAPSPSD